MIDVSELKIQARRVAFARRKAAHSPEKGALATQHLLAFLAPRRGQPTAAYMPIRTEINALTFMADLAQDTPIGVPVIQGAGQPLIFHRWYPDAEMIPGPFGAKIPASAELLAPSVVILPLVAFDARGYRLGYGGGFYDRTLELLRAQGPVLAVGYAYSAQKAEHLPTEPTDQPMDAVVTELGAVTF